tara:strand:- start:3529 stop:4722 length:1194 start_codon:yes stop_codon:yes gene_type:complete
MKKISFLTGVCFLVFSCTKSFIKPSAVCVDNPDLIANSTLHPKANEFEAILTKYYNKEIPGVTVLVSDSSGLWLGAMGYADIEHQIPMQPCHIIKTGSITKMLIGNLIWQLVDEGEIDVEMPISNYIPSVANKITNGNQIKVKMLLNHTSGIYPIARDLGLNLAVVNDFTRSWNLDEVLSYLTHKPATNFPGERVYYANSNTIISCLILEAITGKSTNTLLQERIFEPIGMNNSVYYNYASEFPLNHLAQGYLDFNNNSGAIQNISNMNPGSGNGYTGLYSTVLDLHLFMKALFVDKTLISSNSLDIILGSFVFSESGNWGASSGGINMEEIAFFGDSIRAYGHGGGDLGYSANLIFMEHNNAIVAVCYNYGTQLWTDLGGELGNLKREIYTIVANQ